MLVAEIGESLESSSGVDMGKPDPKCIAQSGQLGLLHFAALLYLQRHYLLNQPRILGIMANGVIPEKRGGGHCPRGD